jgi:hypothetical protein
MLDLVMSQPIDVKFKEVRAPKRPALPARDWNGAYELVEAAVIIGAFLGILLVFTPS